MNSTNHLMHPRTAHNHADNGYFPTDEATLEGIAARLDIAGADLRIFDPCCGTGAALAVLAEHLGSCGAHCHSFGVELDRNRAIEAAGVLDFVVQSDIENCIPTTAYRGFAVSQSAIWFFHRRQPQCGTH